MIPELTQKEIEILGSTLGINVYGAQRSKKKKDRELPDDFYRNRFCAGKNHSDMPVLESLKEKGLMDCTETDILPPGNLFFWVTESGEDVFRIKFFRLMKEPVIQIEK